MNLLVLGSIILIVIFTVGLFLWGEKEDTEKAPVNPKVSVHYIRIPAILRDEEIQHIASDYGMERPDFLHEFKLVLTSEDGSIIRISPDTLATSLDEDIIEDVHKALREYAEAIRLGRR